jgi:putative peptidoglycan lipid II flippase
MGVSLWFAGGATADWLIWPLATRLLHLSLLVCFGASVYFATLWVAGFRLRDFKRSAVE